MNEVPDKQKKSYETPQGDGHLTRVENKPGTSGSNDRPINMEEMGWLLSKQFLI